MLPESMDPVLQQAEDRFKAGDTVQAEALCRQALERAPGNPDALRLLGVLRLKDGRAADALAPLRQSLQVAPDDLGTLDALSVALVAVGDAGAAEAVLRRALALDPGLTVAQLRLGMVLASQNQWAAAARVLEEAAKGDPLPAEAHYELGKALANLGRVSEAIACYRRALALIPANAGFHNALGHALEEIGLREAAMARYERALELDPSLAVAQHNLGQARLHRHEFETGWPLYERRLQCPPARRELRKTLATVELYENLPRWRGPGEAGTGELAIWAEQGIGDQILYSTLIPELERTGLPVVYEMDRRLTGIYERAFPQVRFVPIEDPPREPLRGASHVLLAGSLPALFRTTRKSFARQPDRMLSALPGRVARYQARLDETPARLKVAFSWKSTRKDGPVRMKSATLADFAPLLGVPGASFVDLQYGDTRAERREAEAATGAGLVHFDEVDYFNDLEEVLAILQACDLVITTSNATAHFAGALGKRTWLLYPSDNAPFHYWAPGDDRHSLWYPSVEIVSSVRLANWRQLAHEVAGRLRRELSPAGERRAGVAVPAPENAPISVDEVERAGKEIERASAEIERASALRLEGRLDDAVALVRRALERDPLDARALSELAHALRWQGHLQEAHSAAARAVAIAPGLAVAWFNLGAVQVESGDTGSGIEAYRKALALDPAFAEAWSNLGGALALTGDASGEIDAYFRAVGVNPALAPVWSNLGNALLEAGETREAVSACRRAVELDPGVASAWSNLCNALRAAGNPGEAASAGARAVALEPQSAGVWSNYGCALMEHGEIAQSLDAHRQALEIEPGDARLQYNHGLALERDRRYPVAIAAYRRALSIEPDFPAAGMRLACTLLTIGNFSEGWPEYEWRWREKDAPPKRHDFKPWAGERTPGRRLLLWGEQGVGDELIYSSMIGELADAGMKLTLEIDPRLVRLMQRSFPQVAVVPRTDPPCIAAVSFDCQAPLGSLGRWLRPSFGAFPAHGGYLRADPERTRQFAQRLRHPGQSRVVGISWRSANRDIGAVKSSPLADWEALLKTPGCRFVDLQYGDTAQEREAAGRQGLSLARMEEVDLLNDIEGLAALCGACDLVITVSNVTAHVAGALGKPVWLLAPAAYGRFWYWFPGRDDSPWYPSMRLFTQRSAGDWRETLERVREALVARPRGR